MGLFARSNLAWGLALLAFLAVELSAKDIAGLAPWDSLSRTSWMDEQSYPILKTALLGFLIGLGVHIRWETGLLRTTIGGTLIAVVLNYLW